MKEGLNVSIEDIDDLLPLTSTGRIFLPDDDIVSIVIVDLVGTRRQFSSQTRRERNETLFLRDDRFHIE